MPKANEGKNTKVTAVADPKNEETKAAVPEKAAEKTETAARKADAVVETAEAPKAAPAARTAKKTSTRKSTAKKADKTEKTETVYIQCAGEEFEMAVIMDKVKAATKSLRAVREVSIYVKPEEHRAYYVAKKSKGEEVGSVEI